MTVLDLPAPTKRRRGSARRPAGALLLAGLAHELASPLTLILGRALVLEQQAGSRGEREAAHRIRRAAERCTRLLDLFRAMARCDALMQAGLDLNRVVSEALDSLDEQLAGAGVALQLQLQAELPPLRGAADALHQVLCNLVANACQAMEGQAGARRLQVSTRHLPAHRCVQLAVADSGPGVPPPLAARIFEPFVTTRRDAGGMGIGLSLSAAIARAHGGSLRLAAAGQCGACFVVELPA